MYFAPKAGLDVDGVLNSLLQDKLKNIKPEDNNLIIIHLMGSHEKYSARLPEEYPINFKESGVEYFGNIAKDEEFIKDVLNPYDASIKYTDENLKKMYVSLKQIVPDLSAYIYMPDHSEDVFGQKMHDSGRFNFEMTRIPFFMLFSDKWIQKYTSEYKGLDLHKNDAFTTDLAFELLTGIMKIQTPAYDTKYDLASGQYSINWANAITMRTNKSLQTQFYSKGTEHKLMDDPEFIKGQNIKWLNSLGNNEKILAEYCDSVGSVYEILNDGFTGFEMNVSIKQDTIHVGHGPETVYDMTLDEFLSKIPLDKVKTIWLDVKMLDESTINNTFSQLETLDKKYNLKRRVILESPIVSEKMRIFGDNGWQSTFYIQPDIKGLSIIDSNSAFQIARNKVNTNATLNSTEQQLMNEYAKTLGIVIKNQHERNVSFTSGEIYLFITQYLQPYLSADIGYCTWDIAGKTLLTDKDFSNKIKSSSFNVLQNPRFNTILIMPESMYRVN